MPQPGRIAAFLQVFSLLSLAPLAAALPRYDSSRLEWTKLSYRASKLGVTFTSDIEIEAVPAARAAAGWVGTTAAKPLSPQGSEVLLLKVGSRLMGRRSALDLWLDPATAAALQRTQLETGQKAKHNRYRTLRFAAGGVFSATARPADHEVGKPHSQWSRISDDFKEYPALATGEVVVTEPSALFYVLSTSDLQRPGDRVTTHVYSKNHLVQVDLVVQEITQIRVDYTEASSQGERNVKSRRQVLRVLLQSRPLDRDTGETEFEFLGLRGEVSIFLDPQIRLPLQISGDLKYAGKGQARLRHVVLK